MHQMASTGIRITKTAHTSVYSLGCGVCINCQCLVALPLTVNKTLLKALFAAHLDAGVIWW